MVVLLTERDADGLRGREQLQCGDTEQKDAFPSGQEEVGLTRFHQATRHDMALKMYELFVWGIFHLVFSEHS